MKDDGFDDPTSQLALDKLKVFALLGGRLGPGTHIGHVYTLIVLALSGGMSISELAKKAEMSTAAASRHVRKLRVAPDGDEIRQGFVQVAQSTDARVKRVRLTRRGWAWIHEAIAAVEGQHRHTP